jgi:methyl-accepting chemotaxis protein
MTTTQLQPKPNPDFEDEQLSLKKTSKFQLNSIGSRLFLSVLLAALAGLGGLSYFFYQLLNQEIEAEIKQILSVQVENIEGQLSQSEQYSAGLATGAKSLHREGIKTSQAYEKLALDYFLKRPAIGMSANLGQAPNRLVPDRKGFYPYFYVDPNKPDAPGKLLSPPNDKVRYSEIFSEVENYLEKEYYTLPVKQDKPVWLEPYDWFGITMTTYSLPFKDDRGKILGIAGIDVNVTSLAKQSEGKVLRDSGYFVIVSAGGNLLSYPPDAQKALMRENYQKIPQLQALWSKLTEKSGLVRSGDNIWAYQRVANTDWMMLAAVPESVVVGPVLLSTAGGAAIVAIILSAVVLFYVRWLNGRLQPILDECNKLAATDEQTWTKIEKEDEVGRLSLSFFNLIDKLSLKEEQIRTEVARTIQTEEDLKRSTEAQKEGEALAEDVGQLLDVVAAVEEGDLTVQAPVSDRVTGLVADTFNRLTEELAKVLGQVVGASRQVSQNASNLEEIAATVATNADLQAQGVTQALALSEQVELSAQNATQQLQVSNQALLDLSATVLEGQTAMTGLTQGTEVLRQGSDRIVQQMKTLGEFVGLAEQFVRDQGQIASQTQVLALNASLVAARASEQQNPRQFLVAAKEFEAIADQVSKLAQLTNDGLSVLEQRTTQIQNVVTMVDAEVQNLGGLVGGFTQGVQQSNQAFDNVRVVATDAVRSGETVAKSNQEIISSVQSNATAIRDIADIAQRTAQLTQNARSQSEAMGRLSAQLLERVEFFRLPAEALPQQDPVNLAESEESTIDVAIA